MTQLATGTVFGGMRIDGVAGRGGMGVVYRATQLALDRPVAVKLIAAELAQDPEFRERFKRESTSAARLDHPHVIPILHAGEEGGLLYLVMRFVEGTDLSDLVAARGRLDPAEAATVVAQIGSALDAAHDRGILHRDVKPANIRIAATATGPHAYLTDFGLTRATSGGGGLTMVGTLMGTLDYISPEQLTGGPIDGRVDVYGLGGVLFHALTGHAPFAGRSESAKMWAQVNEPPPSVLGARADLPPGLDGVLGRALAKHPDQRYARAGELGRAAVLATTATLADRPPHAGGVGPVVGPWSGGGAGWSTPPGPQHPSFPPGVAPPIGPPPFPRKRRIGWLVFGAVAIVLVLGAVAVGLFVAAPGPVVPDAAEAVIAGTVVGEPIPVGSEPSDIEVGAGFVWTANSGTDTISRIDPETGAGTEIVVGGRPQEIAVDQGAVWVRNYGDAVTRVDVATSEVSAPVGAGGPQIEGMAVGGGSVWLSHPAEGSVGRIDTSTLQVAATTPVGPEPGALAYGDGRVYVANGGDGTLSTIDAATGSVLGEPLELNADLGGVEVHDGVIYVGTTGDVTPIDELSFVVGQPIPVEGGSVFEVGGDSIWVVHPLQDVIRRSDRISLEPLGEVAGVGAGVAHSRFDGEFLWLSNTADDTVFRIEPAPR